MFPATAAASLNRNVSGGNVVKRWVVFLELSMDATRPSAQTRKYMNDPFPWTASITWVSEVLRTARGRQESQEDAYLRPCGDLLVGRGVSTHPRPPRKPVSRALADLRNDGSRLLGVLTRRALERLDWARATKSVECSRPKLVFVS